MLQVPRDLEGVAKRLARAKLRCAREPRLRLIVGGGVAGLSAILDGIIASAPLFSRVVVVGVCMQPDEIRPAMAINKEIDLRFVVGYTPLEFRDTLHMLAEGKVNAGPVVTGTVGLPGVESAFDALADPETHAKILIDPKTPAGKPSCTK